MTKTKMTEEQYLAAVRRRMKGRLNPCGGCLMWTGGVFKVGYGRVSFRGKGKYAHRIAWILAKGREPLPGHYLVHGCQNKLCCNPDHLVETVNPNLHRNTARGERAGKAKLTAPKVLRIRALWEKGNMTQQQLADQFKVSPQAIWTLLSRRSWMHV